MERATVKMKSNISINIEPSK